MMTDLLFFQPNRVWRTYFGGRELDRLRGKPDPADTHFPEDWIASTSRAINPGQEHFPSEGISEVWNHEGKSLGLFNQVLARDPADLLGVTHFEQYGPTTQVLVKLLDAGVRLQLQCHPTIPFARQYLNSNAGKTEAYYILGIRQEVSNPYIYLGFQHPPSKEEWRAMVLAQDIQRMENCFEQIPVHPGDIFLVPGGLPHAIGEGILMVEVMEPTDYTARVEFERCGYVLPESARFLNRGIDFALEMFDYKRYPVSEILREWSLRPTPNSNQEVEDDLIGPAQTDRFCIHRLTITSRYTPAPEKSFFIGLVTRGQGMVRWKNQSASLREGNSFFKPFSLEELTFETHSPSMEILKIYPPTGNT